MELVLPLRRIEIRRNIFVYIYIYLEGTVHTGIDIEVKKEMPGNRLGEACRVRRAEWLARIGLWIYRWNRFKSQRHHFPKFPVYSIAWSTRYSLWYAFEHGRFTLSLASAIESNRWSSANQHWRGTGQFTASSICMLLSNQVALLLGRRTSGSATGCSHAELNN